MSVLFNPVDAKMKLYLNGTLSTTSTLKSGVPGREASDTLQFSGTVKEFRVLGGIINESELYMRYMNGPSMNLGKWLILE